MGCCGLSKADCCALGAGRWFGSGRRMSADARFLGIPEAEQVAAGEPSPRGEVAVGNPGGAGGGLAGPAGIARRRGP